MRRISLVPVVAAAILLAAANCPANDKSDRDAIQGTWQVIGVEQNGASVPFEKSMRWVFQGGQARILVREITASTADFKLLADQTPKGIDLSKPGGGQVHKASYRLEGDKLILGLPMGPAQDRPRELVSKQGNGIGLMTLERVDPSKPVDDADTASSDPLKAPAKEAREPIYNPEADAKADIAAGVANARFQGKHVLVVFGGNWCGWCYKLHDALKINEDLARLTRNEFVTVMVDSRTNLDLLKSYGEDNDKHGVPFLTVLGPDGGVLTNQNTSDLEDGPIHDVAKVRAFLEKWAPERLDAEVVLKRALEEAKAADKNVLIHAGAPWCGWCRRLEEYLHEQQALFEKDFVVAKIDVDRMENGDEVVARFRGKESDGVPWMVILSPEGAARITSDGPEGNIGCPVDPTEIEHFLTMLEITKKRLTVADLAAVRQSLEEFAKRLER